MDIYKRLKYKGKDDPAMKPEATIQAFAREVLFHAFRELRTSF